MRTYIKRAAGLCLSAAVLLSLWACEAAASEPTPTIDPHEGQVRVSDGAGGTMWVELYEGVSKSAYEPGDFYGEEGYICFSGEGYTALRGIDVSFYQGKIDWDAVAADGVEFAIIRAGYRGYSQGGVFEDEMFRENVSGALEAGLRVGVYFFSQAVNTAEAEEEARFVLELIEGYDVTMPVIFDWENIGNGETARTDNVSGRMLTDCALAFCGAVEAAGYEPGVYFYRRLGYYQYELDRLSGLTLWVSAPGQTPDFYYEHEMWQYSFTGQVEGIEGDTDLNLYFEKHEPEVR